jgi:hypothetical protein
VQPFAEDQQAELLNGRRISNAVGVDFLCFTFGEPLSPVAVEASCC